MLNNKQASALDRLQIHDRNGEIWIKSAKTPYTPMSKLAALISLVTVHGLREVQAREMLKAAAALSVHNKEAAFFIKYADPYGGGYLQPGPGAPQIPEPWFGTEQNGPNSVNAIYPQEETMPVPSLDAGLTDPNVYDPWFQPDSQSMMVAQQAANSGQKDIFDVSSMSGMLKTVNQDNLVDKYLGDLMKAVDRIGRIIFLFYWHQDEFEAKYGREAMPELEDSLRNAFETSSDVALFLMEKSVGGGASYNMPGVGVKADPNTAEPNIQQAAGN
jgi:hypothetical protein